MFEEKRERFDAEKHHAYLKARVENPQGDFFLENSYFVENYTSTKKRCQKDLEKIKETKKIMIEYMQEGFDKTNVFDDVLPILKEKESFLEEEIRLLEIAASDFTEPNCAYFTHFKIVDSNNGCREHTNYWGWGKYVSIKTPEKGKCVFCPDELRCNGCFAKLCAKNHYWKEEEK